MWRGRSCHVVRIATRRVRRVGVFCRCQLKTRSLNCPGLISELASDHERAKVRNLRRTKALFVEQYVGKPRRMFDNGGSPLVVTLQPTSGRQWHHPSDTLADGLKNHYKIITWFRSSSQLRNRYENISTTTKVHHKTPSRATPSNTKVNYLIENVRKHDMVIR